MRHSRRAVMTEHYKLYLKKNVFNGRYFVRNVQIGICTAAVGVLIAGAAGVVTMGHKSGATEAKNSVKEALFGVETTENTEAVLMAENVVVKEAADQKAADQKEMAELVTEDQKDVEETVVSTEQETLVQATTEQKSEFDGKCIANVEETLNIRKEPSTDAEFVGSMSNGAIALVEGTDGEWTKIKSGDVEGYVLTDYILTGEDAEELAEEHVTLVGTVLEDGVNVRMEQSTDAGILTVLNKDDTISVLGSSVKEDTQKEDGNEEQPADETPAAADSTEEDSTEQASETSEQTVTEEAEMQETEESAETVTAQTETSEEEKIPAIETEKTSEEEASSEQLPSITEAVEEMTAVQEEEQQEIKAEEDSEVQVETQTSTQEITWIPVMLEDGQVGYVSAELVDVDRLYELAVSAEELERKAREEEEARRAAEEEAWRQAQAEAAANSYDSSSDYSGSDSGSSNYSGSDSGSSSSSYSGETVTPVTASASGECLGTFTLTAYCGCSKCSGGHNLTATGTTPAEGRTIAADPSVLPYGTQVVIDGVVYTVEDCGSGVSGNHIDIFCATHDSALAFGRRTAKVYKY